MKLSAIQRRIIVGVSVALFWVVAVAWMPSWVVFLLFLGAVVVCQLEFAKMMSPEKSFRGAKCYVTAGALWLASCYIFPFTLMAQSPKLVWLEALLLISFGFLLLCRLLFDERVKDPVHCAAYSILGFFYLPFMLSFFLRLAQWGAKGQCEITAEGLFLAAYTAIVVKFSDIGGFALGVTCGKHKMFPRISPAKSWEGLAGGIAASMGVSMGLVALAQCCPWLHGGVLAGFSMVQAAGVGAVLAGVGVLGDLIESMFKRSAKIKDSGGVFPGLGGLLDTFDSLIFAPAALFFYLIWIS